MGKGRRKQLQNRLDAANAPPRRPELPPSLRRDDLPVRVQRSKDEKKLVAARNITLGEVILSEVPFAMVPRFELRTTHCLNCLAQLGPNNLFPCANGCGFAYYCSEECRDRDQATHSLECPALQLLASKDGIEPSLIAATRITIRNIVAATVVDQSPIPNAPVAMPMRASLEDIHAIETQYDDMDPVFRERIQGVLTQILPALPKQARCAPEEAAAWTCRIVSSGNEVCPDGTHAVGAALFGFLSLVSHSCWPTSVFTWTGRCMELRAIRPIQANEDITVSFVGLYKPARLRQMDLVTTRHVWCECPRCTGEAELRRDAPIAGYRCVRCSGQVDPQAVTAAEKASASTETTSVASTSNAESTPAPAPAMSHADNSSKRSAGSVGCVVPEDILRSVPHPAQARIRVSPTDVWRCIDCGHEQEAQPFVIAEKLSHTLLHQARQAASARDAPACLNALRTLLGIDDGEPCPDGMLPRSSRAPARYMHPDHHVVLDASVLYANILAVVGDLAGAMEQSIGVAERMERHLPQYHPELGMIYASIVDFARSILQSKEKAQQGGRPLPPADILCRARDCAMTYSRRCHELRRIAYGPSHPFTRQISEQSFDIFGLGV